MALIWKLNQVAEGPVFVAGLFGSPAGVGQSARLFADALEGFGVAIRRVDVGPSLGIKSVLPVADDDPHGPGIIISFLNPPELLRWLGGGGAPILRGKRHVGYWFWELADAPRAWAPAIRYVDEIWCQSRFTASALEKLVHGRKSVRILPHPVFVNGRRSQRRDRYNLDEDTCVVLASFDLRSTSGRKNPLGALKAYINAVPHPQPQKSLLICKMRSAAIENSVAEELILASKERSDIRIIQDELSGDDMLSLVQSVDIVVSLHRAEGFGLLAAEAMWLGKAVVTTGWSGVLDFATTETAALVNWKMMPVADAQGIYVSGEWAEPDLDDAAAKLRALIDDPVARARLGANAAAHAATTFSQEAWMLNLTSHLRANGVPLPDRSSCARIHTA